MTTPYNDPSFSYASPYKPEEKKPPAWKTVLAWIGLLFGALLTVGSPAQMDAKTVAASLLMGLAFLLPSGWYLLHRRREKRGAEPMNKHWGVVWAVFAVLMFAAFIFVPKSPQVPTPATVETNTPTASETSKKTTTEETTPTTSSATPSTEPTSTMTREPAPVEEQPENTPEEANQPEEQPYVEQPAEVAPEAPAPVEEDTGVYYGSCKQAKAAGAAPLYAGMPGYSLSLDRDGDGVACEN